jgi:protease II
VDNP